MSLTGIGGSPGEKPANRVEAMMTKEAPRNDVICPECGGQNVMHYTDAFILRTPVVRRGGVALVDCDTEEYDAFFQCPDCGHKPSEAELVAHSSH
jgi:rubredoxin